MQLKVSYSLFDTARSSFWQNCRSSDNLAKIEYVTVDSNASPDPFDKFLGDAPVVKVEADLPFLYNFQELGHKREAFGIHKDIDSVIYVSPIDMESNFGFWKIPSTLRIHVTVFDNKFYIESVNYLERMFSSCVAMQLQLKYAIDN